MSVKKRNFNTSFAENIRLVSLKDVSCKKLSKPYSDVNPSMSRNIYFVKCSSFREYFGYGNDETKEMTEYINLNSIDNPVILEDFGYLFLSYGKGEISNNCCLFFDFADYIAFLSIQKKIFSFISESCDCVILHHVSNFVSMVASTDGYSNIYMFFPNNDTGITIAKTIKARNPKHVHDCSPLYASDMTLHDYCNRLFY